MKIETAALYGIGLASLLPQMVLWLLELDVIPY